MAYCPSIKSLGYGFGFMPFLRSIYPFGTDSKTWPSSSTSPSDGDVFRAKWQRQPAWRPLQQRRSCFPRSLSNPGRRVPASSKGNLSKLRLLDFYRGGRLITSPCRADIIGLP